MQTGPGWGLGCGGGLLCHPCFLAGLNPLPMFTLLEHPLPVPRMPSCHPMLPALNRLAPAAIGQVAAPQGGPGFPAGASYSQGVWKCFYAAFTTPDTLVQ